MPDVLSTSLREAAARAIHEASGEPLTYDGHENVREHFGDLADAVLLVTERDRAEAVAAAYFAGAEAHHAATGEVLPDMIAAAVAAERERITQAIEALPPLEHVYGGDCLDAEALDAVRAQGCSE